MSKSTTVNLVVLAGAEDIKGRMIPKMLNSTETVLRARHSPESVISRKLCKWLMVDKRGMSVPFSIRIVTAR